MRQRAVVVATAAMLLAVGCGSSGGGGGGGIGSPAGEQEAVTACIAIGSCVGEGVNDCFDDLLGRLTPDQLRCAAAAGGDCAAVQGCLGLTLVADPGCAPGRRCEGDTLVECVDGVRSAVDCARFFESPGPRCVEAAGGPTCGVASCAAPEESCDGSLARSCDLDRGVVEQQDCALFGLTCELGGGRARCGDGVATPCEGDGVLGCDDSLVISCEGGEETRADCAAAVAGRRCQLGASGATCGFGTACDPATSKGQESCSGTTISFCAGGAQRSVDCASVGFTTCQAGAVTGGRCVP